MRQHEIPYDNMRHQTHHKTLWESVRHHEIPIYTMRLHKTLWDMKKKLSLKMKTLSPCKKRTDLDEPANYSVFCSAAPLEICANWRLSLAQYKGCTSARCIWKGSWEDGGYKNVNPQSVQKAHQPGRACKLHRLLILRCLKPVVQLDKTSSRMLKMTATIKYCPIKLFNLSIRNLPSIL